MSGPQHMVGGEHRGVSDRVFLVLAVGRQVAQVGNASNEAAIVLAIDHRPVPNSVHASPPFVPPKGNETIGGDATADPH
jgi:hypothetical protein